MSLTETETADEAEVEYDGGVSDGTPFDRDRMARLYAGRHARFPGVREVYYLPAGAPEKEVRLLEVNDMMPILESAPPEAWDGAVDIDGQRGGHTLMLLDLSPTQWEKVRAGTLALPPGWTLDGAVPFHPVPA